MEVGEGLNNHSEEPLEILKVLVGSDHLLFLQELIDYLQKYWVENKSEWMEQYFELIYQTSFQSNSLLELQQYCINLMAKSPETIFKSLDFTSLSEKSLNPTLLPDPTTWSDDDFKMMENTLQHCLPLIRFFSFSSDDFFQKVRPYKKILKRQLYEELLESYLNSSSEPSDNILLPQCRNIDGIIDTKIVNLNIASLISRWIDKVDIKSKFAHIRELYLPYKFILLLRGSKDEFTPKRFHELCDNIPHTVIFIKIKGTEEIINPLNGSHVITINLVKPKIIYI
ncbi:hypothetical protein RclHR1_04970004 [Rhizophagus clarus]|uniref:TLDc domain-containing protein n=1 Tax=Rhizophagus clarus TaxID=94130 RepID=A0A2Z6S1Q7_9GLOM|nr:hypothetical protein RclHR1_04970004 [Rhizophagus clarus]